MHEWNNFIANKQASTQGVFVSRVNVTIAKENFVAGVVLSQIIYWYSPSRDGRRKLRVRAEHPQSYERMYCLAKSQSEWENEIGISPKQARGAIEKLDKMGLIDTKIDRFKGNNVTHIFLDKEYYAELRKDALSRWL